ncbi:hypothetical protein [Aurantiacibacter aquimixticola]|uniref:Uncharacterized protein n=1 Tax=Aurantiacibacter aquimixticola TaxID=1958945 RepID=A0A419RNH9_9SPHN|nr:hypothetical protein [Aurantiacibacter aquimixticola]RJY06940.1 hypothetical protein D6201_12750 [Aurantiacibacter aquimixticola]
MAHWLPRFDGAVFANFLIQSAHARVIDARLGIGSRDERLLASQLFNVESETSLSANGLYAMTLRFWERFCECHGIDDHGGHIILDFGVDGGFVLSSDQPGSETRL